VTGWLEVIGLAGIIVALAGVHQLWQARDEAFFWTQRFFDIFRVALGEKGRIASDRSAEAQQRPPAHSTLHLIGGVGLIALGSFLFLFSLALVVYRSWSDS
jgi:hypothetical protein